MAASLLKGRGIKSFAIENFGAGLDLRETYYTLDQNRFAVLNNAFVTKGRKIRRRPPCRLVSGVFDTTSQGLINVNGSLTTFALRGASPALAAGVVAAFLDMPPGASTTWALTDYTTLNNVACALVLHTMTAGYTQLWLHVLDAAPDQQTYVTDPAFPWAHTFNPTILPRMTVAAEKLWVSGPDFNPYESGTAAPRVWNDFQQSDFVTSGIEFHAYCAAAGAQSFSVPLDFSKFMSWAGYQAYVLQQYIGPTNPPVWTNDTYWGTAGNPDFNILEVAGAPAADQMQVVGVANPAQKTSFAQWAQVNVNPSVAGTWYRLRVLVPADWPLPLSQYVSQGGIPWTDPAGFGLSQLYENIGDGSTVAFLLPANFLYLAAANNAIAITVNGASKALGPDFSIGQDAVTGRMIITFTSAPGASLPIIIYQTFETGAYLLVPPGTVVTRTGTYQFPGGWFLCPLSHPNLVVCLSLTAGGVPNTTPSSNGLVAIDGISGNVLSGKDRYENVPMLYIPTDGGGITGQGQPFIPKYRSQVWDQTAFLLGGLNAGFENAGFIASSNYETSGGPITAMVQYSNRLLVLYQNASLLYSVAGNPVNNRLLDSSAIGTGVQPNPYGCEIYGMVIVPSINGFRALDLTRFAPDDNLQDLDIGDPIAALGSPPMQANAYWPYQGEYLAATQINGELGWFCFDYSKASKIASWSQWQTVGIAGVDYRAMVPMNDRMYFRSATQLYYFDASVTAALYDPTIANYYDDNDYNVSINPSLIPYETELWWHYNNVKTPTREKRWVGIELIMDGTATVTFRTQPWSPLFEDGNTEWTGVTIGKPGVPLSMTTKAIAPVFRSTDPTGFNLEAYVLNFCLLGQGVL